MNNIVEFVQSQEQFFTPAVADNAVAWKKESQFAIQLFQKNDYLAKIAMSNQVSAQNAIINVAAIGITLNPAMKLAYLVPRDGGVCLDISYMGLMHLAMQSGSIRWGQCEIVYKNDNFKRVGVGQAPLHECDEFGERGDPVGAYCVVKTSDGDFLTETMSKKDIEAIRDRSQGWKAYKKKGAQTPWVTDELEMWRKTVVKRGSKYWPKVERLDKAIEYLNETGDGFEKEPVMPHYSEKEVIELERKADESLVAEISGLCDEMAKAETFESLKALFSTAYTRTKGHPLNKNVQIIYNEAKGKFNV